LRKLFLGELVNCYPQVGIAIDSLLSNQANRPDDHMPVYSDEEKQGFWEKTTLAEWLNGLGEDADETPLKRTKVERILTL